jgi:hypothetical protein
MVVRVVVRLFSILNPHHPTTGGQTGGRTNARPVTDPKVARYSLRMSPTYYVVPHYVEIGTPTSVSAVAPLERLSTFPTLYDICHHGQSVS